MSMTSLRRAAALVVFAAMSVPAFAARIGPEVPATDSAGAQRNVVISREISRTLIAFDETAGEGQLSRVVVHQYESNLGIPLGRATFSVDPSTHHQRRPAFGRNMVAWVEEDPHGPGASLWWQGLGGYEIGSNYGPEGSSERVADVARGTRIEVVNTHVFHVILWTAPDGRLMGVYRSLLALIGYDPSPFPVTVEAAMNPSAAEDWNDGVLIAYNDAASSAMRATTLARRGTQQTVDIAPAGASAPRVVFNGTDFIVFWSMPDGATYAQRVSAVGGLAVKIGSARRIGDGTLHAASFGADDEYFLAVEREGRFALLRFDRDLDLLEEASFTARLAPGERVSLSSEFRLRPMLAYGARRRGGEVPEAVFRVVDEGVKAQRRRSMR
jgi:hypothetical protein